MKKRINELYFEEIGEDFENWASPYDTNRRIALIKKLLPAQAKDLTCLEIGCGFGKISEAMLPLVGSLTVTDVSRVLAEKTGKKFNIPWMQQDACNLTISDNEYDLVISSECIEHTPDPFKALKEMGRVVKPGGTVIVTSPNKLWYPLIWLVQALKVRKFHGNEYWLFPFEAKKVFLQSGFDHIKTGGCHLFPWQIPLAKTLLPIFDRFDFILYPLMINYGICAQKSEKSF